MLKPFVNQFEKEKLFLVGIAASAGGLKPMQELLANASCHGSMAFVVASHLSRHQPSDLTKILERASTLTTCEVKDGLEIENCHLYTIPPDRYVKVEGSKFRVLPRPESGPNFAADVLFESLAKTYNENAIAVVLSGASVGADGSAGIKLVKAQGGHTYAQAPDLAEFPDMPRLAIETGAVDSVASPEMIGHDLSLVSWASPTKRSL